MRNVTLLHVVIHGLRKYNSELKYAKHLTSLFLCHTRQLITLTPCIKLTDIAVTFSNFQLPIPTLHV